MNLRRRRHDAGKAVAHGWGIASAAFTLALEADRRGPGARFIGRRPVIVNRGVLEIGADFRARSVVHRTLLETGPDGRLEIGDAVFVNQGTCVYAECSVRIGDRVDIGDMVRIYDTNFHPTRPGAQTRVAPVVIEDDVWLASGAVVLPGVTIGRGSVVGAGAVVTESVPPGSLVAGPAARTVSTFEVPDGFERRRGFRRSNP